VDVSLRGHGFRITDQLRSKTAQKAAKLARLDSGAERVEIEVTPERGGGDSRLNGTKRVEATLVLRRHTVRAHATSPDVDAALDQVVERLERQVREYRAKRKKRLLPGANPLKSPRTGPERRRDEA
jgi:putative sigma-54 modulation protein